MSARPEATDGLPMLLPLPDFIAGHRPDLVAAVVAMPVVRLLELEIVGLGDGVAVLALPLSRAVTFDGVTAQGGIVGLLADYAAVCAAVAAMPPKSSASTTAFTVHNLAPACGDQLVGVGRLVHGGVSQAVAQADIYAVTGEECALVGTALVTCRLNRPAT